MSAQLIPADFRYHGSFDKIYEYLESALPYGGDRDWDLEHIKESFLQDLIHVWALESDGKLFGACVSQEVFYPKRKVLRVHLVGTDKNKKEKLLECFDQLKALAKSNGCSYIQGFGRAGWAKLIGAETINMFEVNLDE